MIHSPAEEKLFGNDLKYTCLHEIFETILSSYVEAQKHDALANVSLQLGNMTKKVNLKIPCFLLEVICKEVINSVPVPLHIPIPYDAYVMPATLLVAMQETPTLNVNVLRVVK